MMQSTSMRPSVASFGNVAGLKPQSLRSPAPQAQRLVVRAAGAAGRVGGGSPTGPQGTGLDFVPDTQKRTVMNLLLVGALGLPGTALLGPFVYFFVPKRCFPLARTDPMPCMYPPGTPLHVIPDACIVYVFHPQIDAASQLGLRWRWRGGEGRARQRRQGLEVAGVPQERRSQPDAGPQGQLLLPRMCVSGSELRLAKMY